MDSDGMNRSFAPHVDLVGQDNLAAAERVLGLLSLLPRKSRPWVFWSEPWPTLKVLSTPEATAPFVHRAPDNTTHA